MSTTKAELEQLRQARQAAREAEEARVKYEAEKAAEEAKKEAFRKRTAMFTKKPGPSDEEVIQKVRQEEQKRKFNRKLNRMLSDDPTENPVNAEYSLRNGLSQSKSSTSDDGESDWMLIEEEGITPYYWNRRTYVSTYDSPFEISSTAGTEGAATPKPSRPPPPPPRRLVGLNESKDIAWMKVIPDEGEPYYWNKYTNESKYEEPEEFLEYDVMTAQVSQGDDALSQTNHPASAGSGADLESTVYSTFESENRVDPIAELEDDQDVVLGTTWEEYIDPNSGEITYIHQNEDGSSIIRNDRPIGTLYIVVAEYIDGQGVERPRESWECVIGSDIDNDPESKDLVYYKSLTTGEVVNDKPIGQSVIVEDA